MNMYTYITIYFTLFFIDSNAAEEEVKTISSSLKKKKKNLNKLMKLSDGKSTTATPQKEEEEEDGVTEDAVTEDFSEDLSAKKAAPAAPAKKIYDRAFAGMASAKKAGGYKKKTKY